jgi:peptidoglycan/LPS O-acetylase OafA/YrhL
LTVNEIFPIVTGLVIGMLLRITPRRFRLAVGPVAVLAVGAIATIISGEYELGWEYLLVDVPLAALTAAAGYIAVPRLAPRFLRHQQPSDT